MASWDGTLWQVCVEGASPASPTKALMLATVLLYDLLGFVECFTDVFVAGATEFGEYARGQRSIGLESLVSAAAASTDVVLKAKTLAAAVLRGYDDVHTLSEGPLSSWPSRLDASKLQQLYAAIRLRSVIRVQVRQPRDSWNVCYMADVALLLLFSPGPKCIFCSC